MHCCYHFLCYVRLYPVCMHLNIMFFVSSSGVVQSLCCLTSVHCPSIAIIDYKDNIPQLHSAEKIL